MNGSLDSSSFGFPLADDSFAPKFGQLAPWACIPVAGRRRFAESSAPTRNEFQRDRDRIVHCSAFRRLVYKTQVFLNHEGDLFRTRLTHSLEVSQLGRAIARVLGLHEDLVEALALAHDLGHTPFGHAGQDELNECMSGHGGFEHNLQSLRVVDVLEQRYPQWDGLNLTLETRSGILKRCPESLVRQMEEAEPGGPAYRFLNGYSASLEAQVTNLADEIAYNAHDVDDGVRSGLISLDQLRKVPIVAFFHDEALSEFPQLATMAQRRQLAETIRRMLSAQVYDLILASMSELKKASPDSPESAQRMGPLIRFSPEMRKASSELKRFLFANLYRHPQVMETTGKARKVLRELFHAYRLYPSEIPGEFRKHDEDFRGIADYVAGMTDRFAIREHHRLTGQSVFASQ